jgi:hypothetical protein
MSLRYWHGQQQPSVQLQLMTGPDHVGSPGAGCSASSDSSTKHNVSSMYKFCSMHASSSVLPVAGHAEEDTHCKRRGSLCIPDSGHHPSQQQMTATRGMTARAPVCAAKFCLRMALTAVGCPLCMELCSRCSVRRRRETHQRRTQPHTRLASQGTPGCGGCPTPGRRHTSTTPAEHSARVAAQRE